MSQSCGQSATSWTGEHQKIGPNCGLILKMEVRDAAHRTQTEHSQASKAHVRSRAQWDGALRSQPSFARAFGRLVPQEQKLASSIACSTLKRSTTDCAKKSAPSIPRRATSFTSLLCCQNMAAQKTPKSRAHALDKSVRHCSFPVGHIFLKRGQYLWIERRLPIAGQLLGHAFCGQSVGVARALFVPSFKGFVIKQI